MPEEKKPEKKAPDPVVTMLHETNRHDFTLAIGDETFAVKAGEAQISLSLVEAAEMAGFRRVT
jgi:hypothetical protein